MGIERGGEAAGGEESSLESPCSRQRSVAWRVYLHCLIVEFDLISTFKLCIHLTNWFMYCYIQRLLSLTMYDHSSQQSFCPAVCTVQC